MNQIITTIIQVTMVMAIAPFAAGLVKFFKARLQGRRGASPFLPYWTFATLLKKEIVIPQASSLIFRLVPFVVLATSISLTFIMPLIFYGTKFAGFSDFMVFGGILLISSIFLVLGGLDPGSAFGGMGSSREMSLVALLEPTMIIIFAAFGFVAKTFSIDGMISQNILYSNPFLILSLISLCMFALAENARYPVDNPATHLELTMVHEAMILEYSGTYLAMLEYASAIKLTVFALLISGFVFPGSVFAITGLSFVSIITCILIMFVRIVIVMGVLALIENILVKMRFYRMSEYMSLAFLISFFGIIGVLVSSFSGINIKYYNVFSMFAVILTVMLFGRVRFRAIVRYYALSSLSIGLIAYSLAMILPKEERLHLYIFAVVTILVKSIIIPIVINKISHIKKNTTNLASFMKPGASYFFASIILFMSFFVFKTNSINEMIELDNLLYAAVSVIILGLAMMIIKRNIFSEIIGLLVIENGIAIFVLATVGFLPLSIEIGVFMITIISAFILSILSDRIREFHDSTDTDKLSKLTE